MAQATDEQIAHEAARQILKLFEHVAKCKEIFDQAQKTKADHTAAIKELQREREDVEKVKKEKDALLALIDREVHQKREQTQAEIGKLERDSAHKIKTVEEETAKKVEAAEKHLGVLGTQVATLSKQREDLSKLLSDERDQYNKERAEMEKNKKALEDQLGSLRKRIAQIQSGLGAALQERDVAVGDAVVNNSSVLTTAFLDIQPGAGIEWFVHHIFHEAEVELYWYDGTNDILIGSPTGANYESMQVRVTNSIRLRVKNVNVGTKRIGYDAVITK